MEATFLSPPTNPSSTPLQKNTKTMSSSSESIENPEPVRSQSEKQHQNPDTQIPDPPVADYHPKEHHEEGFFEDEVNQDGEEEEEGECGFCLFMKGGGCRETFTSWEDCIEEAEKKNEDIVEKCFEVTSALKKCMLEHSDYYEPILQAEKAAEEVAVNELEKEKAQESGSQDQVISEDKNEGS